MRNLQAISDPDAVAALLKDKRLDPFPFRDKYQQLEDRLGVDFSSILFVMGYSATVLPEPGHMQIRQRQARMLRTRSDAARAALPDIIAKAFAVLNTPGDHDMMADVIAPIVDQFQTLITGFDARLDAATPVSFLSSYGIGVSKRRRLETNVKKLKDAVSAEIGADDIDKVGDAMLLYLLASDSLLGMLGRSVHHFLMADDAERAATPPEPTHTGVPFVLRVAQEDLETGGVALQKGDVVELRLDSGDGAAARSQRLNFFGNGDRTCIGRPLTFAIWQDMLGHLQALDREVTVLSYAIREDEFFAVPENFVVRVT